MAKVVRPGRQRRAVLRRRENPGAGRLLPSAALAETGTYAVVGLRVLLLPAVSVICWMIADRARTRNAVALITAVRSQPATPTVGPGVTGDDGSSATHEPLHPEEPPTDEDPVRPSG